MSTGIKVNVKRTVEVNITTSEDVAKWLKDFIQNNNSGNYEDPDHAMYRRDLFIALKLALAEDNAGETV